MTMKAFLAKFHRSSGSRIIAPESIRDSHDIFACLPFELHILIIAYLEPGDIDAALGASCILRRVWLSEESWPAIADRWYPGLAQHIRMTGFKEPESSELFHRCLHRMCRRTEGKFSAAMHYGFGLASDEFFQLSKVIPVSDGGVHSYESVENLVIDDAQRYTRFMIYSNGRVAWWPEAYSMPYLAVVDDLRTRVRRAYLFPNHDKRSRGYKTAMGKTLFIMGHETKLHVWHLELNRLESFEVPENPERCITEGETVLVVSQTSDVYIWKFGQKLQHINMHRLSCYPREHVVSGGPTTWPPRIWLSSQRGLHLRYSRLLIDFILSPTVSGVFFVGTLAIDESRKLTVHEIRDGEIAATYVLEERIFSDPRTTERGLLRWEKLNSFGGYSLVRVIQEPATADDACPCGRKSRELVSLCFNIYTRSFSILRHHLGELSPWISHVWNDRLLIMDARFHGRQTATTPCPVMSIAPCSGIDTSQNNIAPVPMFTTIYDDVPYVCRRHQLPFDIDNLGERLDVEHRIDVLQEFSPHPRWNGSFIPSLSEMSPGRLVGDDDFFLFVNTPSYTVLSFGQEFPTRPLITEEMTPAMQTSTSRIFLTWKN
ncbi:hypothetical protein GGS21DRAFT_493931 [Xylaria nigripes]|nr:hypothetical protein GGS21DRAFT_493931 [Xylaria nigripes]